MKPVRSDAEATEQRVARRLAGTGAYVETDAERVAWLVAGPNRSRVRIAEETLRRLQARGALAADAGGRLVLSEAGRVMVRRQLAGGGDFAGQHQTRARRILDGDGVRRAVTVDLGESPLAWLRSRKGRDGAPMIGAAAFDAGERLRSDFTRGQLMPGITANWSATAGSGRRTGDAGGIADLTDAALAARLRVQRAIVALGPELSGVVVDFCCFLKGIEAIERDRNWPKRSARLVLQLGLSALARHYGLSETAHGPGSAPGAPARRPYAAG